MYVKVSGAQYYKNEDGKITDDLYPLEPCKKLDNKTLSNLEIDIEKRLLKDKPYCIDKKYNYTIMNYDKAKVRKALSIDISKCTNTSTQTCYSDAIINDFLTQHQFIIYSYQRKIDFNYINVKNQTNPFYREF
jgi:hypothetical protein